MVIDPYNYQKATNIKEHNEMVAKLNEVIKAVNQGGTDVDTYTKGEINAKVLDAVVRAENYTDEIAQKKLTAGVGIHISDNNIISADVEPGTEILPFTNFQAGSIVGNVDQDGNIYAVETGIGRVLGWDELKERVNDDELAIAQKQDKLKAGRHITIDPDNTINADVETVDAYTKAETDNLLAGKQAKLTAGNNITIDGNNVISASFNSYTRNEIDAKLDQKQIKLIPGTGISLDSAGNISATGQIDAYTKQETNNLLAQKQNTLVSGSNIKTINSQSILGAGNIVISGGTVDHDISPSSTNPVQNRAIYSALQNKQDKLISGTNIKTINNLSLLGSGNIAITGDDYRLEQGTASNPNTVYLKKQTQVVSTIKTYVPEAHSVSITTEGDHTLRFVKTYNTPPIVLISGVRDSDSEPNHPVYIRTISTSDVVISNRGSTYSQLMVIVIDRYAVSEYYGVDPSEFIHEW